MKLSEAIQLGSTLKPQAFHEFSDGESTCAMGAALDAVGQLKKMNQTNEKRVKKIWPWLNWCFRRTHCPRCGKVEWFRSVYNFIVHLNDDDHLPRPQIASFISEIEGHALKEIELLVPSYQTLRLAELEANLSQSRKKRTSSRKAEDIIPETTLTQG